MKIHSLHDRVVAKRLAEKEQTSDGRFVPDTAKGSPFEAQVVAVDDGKTFENGTMQPLLVHVGDRVLIGDYTGSEMRIDGEDHIILREDDVLAILDSGEAAYDIQGHSVQHRRP